MSFTKEQIQMLAQAERDMDEGPPDRDWETIADGI